MSLRSAFLRSGLLAVTLLALAACDKAPAPAKSPAQPAATTHAASAVPGLVVGTDYVDIKDGAPFEPAANSIEVAEVFGYTCPHCAHFEPTLEAWRAKQAADVRFVAVPAPFGDYWMPFAKAYYAAQETGLADKTHAAVFNAIHVEHSLPAPPAVATNEQIAAFYARHGADPADFAKRMDSFSVQARVRRATQFIERSGVDGTPTLVVAGKYRVNGNGPDDALRIVDALVAYERAAAHK